MMRFSALLLVMTFGLAQAAPRVVTSIQPLQEISAAIMQGVSEPQTIIDDSLSAHHFSLRPSQMRLLQKADLVIWIGNHFESGFHNLSGSLPTSSRQLELMPALQLAKGDGHLWHSPRRVVQIVELIQTTLSEIDPQNAEHYRKNADQLEADIEDWRAQTQRNWQNGFPPFITDHAFLKHFASDFKLVKVISIHDSRHQPIGIKALKRVEQVLQNRPIDCLLTQDQPISRMAMNLTQKYRIPIIQLQTGLDTKSNSVGILRRFEQLAMALQKCSNTE